MASLIHFMVTSGKWLESACSAVILGNLSLVCCLYDGIEVTGDKGVSG